MSETRAKYRPTETHELTERLDFSVTSSSSSPYQQGDIEVRASPTGMQIRWKDDREWKSIEWHEIVEVAMADAGRLLSSNAEDAREQGYSEGLKQAYEDAVKTPEVLQNIARAKQIHAVKLAAD